MRIIAGSHRGHKIHAPHGRDVRPTSDRVRENVFNILGAVDGATVLDLYAGSGAMGLEALSRGAVKAVFVEQDGDAVRTIERNLDKLHLSGTVLRQDAVTALASEAGSGRKYDLVLVVETGARVEPDLPLPQRTSRKYGQARVTVFEAAP